MLRTTIFALLMLAAISLRSENQASAPGGAASEPKAEKASCDGERAGLNLNLFSIQNGVMDGMQIAIIDNASASKINGMQLSIIGTSNAENVNGVQSSVVASVADSVAGAQASTVNVVHEFSGAQLRVVNYASEGQGAQFGLVNVIKDGVIPFMPVMNIGF